MDQQMMELDNNTATEAGVRAVSKGGHFPFILPVVAVFYRSHIYIYICRVYIYAVFYRSHIYIGHIYFIGHI